MKHFLAIKSSALNGEPEHTRTIKNSSSLPSQLSCCTGDCILCGKVSLKYFKHCGCNNIRLNLVQFKETLISEHFMCHLSRVQMCTFHIAWREILIQPLAMRWTAVTPTQVRNDLLTSLGISSIFCIRCLKFFILLTSSAIYLLEIRIVLPSAQWMA